MELICHLHFIICECYSYHRASYLFSRNTKLVMFNEHESIHAESISGKFGCFCLVKAHKDESCWMGSIHSRHCPNGDDSSSLFYTVDNCFTSITNQPINLLGALPQPVRSTCRYLGMLASNGDKLFLNRWIFENAQTIRQLSTVDIYIYVRV